MSNLCRSLEEPCPCARSRCGEQMSYSAKNPETWGSPKMPNPDVHSKNYRGVRIKDRKGYGGHIGNRGGAGEDSFRKYKNQEEYPEQLPQEYEEYGNQQAHRQYWEPCRCCGSPPSLPPLPPKCRGQQSPSPHQRYCRQKRPQSQQKCRGQQPSPPPQRCYEHQPSASSQTSCECQSPPLPPQKCYEKQPPPPSQRYCCLTNPSPQRYSCQNNPPSPQRSCGQDNQPSPQRSCGQDNAPSPQRSCGQDNLTSSQRSSCQDNAPSPQRSCGQDNLTSSQRSSCHDDSPPPMRYCCQENSSPPKMCSCQENASPPKRCSWQENPSPPKMCSCQENPSPPKECSCQENPSPPKRCSWQENLQYNCQDQENVRKCRDKRRRKRWCSRRINCCSCSCDCVCVVTHEMGIQTDDQPPCQPEAPIPDRIEIIDVTTQEREIRHRNGEIEIVVDEIQTVTVVPNDGSAPTKRQVLSRTDSTNPNDPQRIETHIKEEIDPDSIEVPDKALRYSKLEPIMETLKNLPTASPPGYSSPLEGKERRVYTTKEQFEQPTERDTGKKMTKTVLDDPVEEEDLPSPGKRSPKRPPKIRSPVTKEVLSPKQKKTLNSASKKPASKFSSKTTMKEDMKQTPKPIAYKYIRHGSKKQAEAPKKRKNSVGRMVPKSIAYKYKRQDSKKNKANSLMKDSDISLVAKPVKKPGQDSKKNKKANSLKKDSDRSLIAKPVKKPEQDSKKNKKAISMMKDSDGSLVANPVKKPVSFKNIKQDSDEEIYINVIKDSDENVRPKPKSTRKQTAADKIKDLDGSLLATLKATKNNEQNLKKEEDTSNVIKDSEGNLVLKPVASDFSQMSTVHVKVTNRREKLSQKAGRKSVHQDAVFETKISELRLISPISEEEEEEEPEPEPEPEPKPKRKKRKKVPKNECNYCYPSNDLVCRMHRPLKCRQKCDPRPCRAACGMCAGAGGGAGCRRLTLPCFVPCSGALNSRCMPPRCTGATQCDPIYGFGSVPSAYYCHR